MDRAGPTWLRQLAGLSRAALAGGAILAAPPAVASPSMSDMAGQMIVIGFDGASAGSTGARRARELIADGTIGGVMFMQGNVASLAEVARMTGLFRSARPALPPLIALDQEGGAVNRLTAAIGFAPVPSAETIGRGTVERAETIYANLGERLAALGFNLNLAPVVDLDINPRNPVIGRYRRAFSADPALVVDFARAFIRGHRAAGVLTAVKHFPGHGSSNADTHDGFVDVTATWQAAELDPYRTLIDDGLVDMVMVAHVANGLAAPSRHPRLPASLAPEWVGGVLRGDLGYDGVVISDDLGMAAISARFSLREAVVAAVMAGTDILLFSGFDGVGAPALAGEINAILAEEAAASRAFAARIAESYARIVALKARLPAPDP